MNKKFSHETARGIRIGFAGFVVAFAGIIVGFVGFYINYKWVSQVSFAVVVVGVLMGFAGVVYGWMHGAKHAISGSIHATGNMSAQLRRWLRRSRSN